MIKYDHFKLICNETRLLIFVLVTVGHCPTFTGFLNLFLSFCISWAAPAAYGGSQARGRIRAAAASLCQSHSNKGFEPCLQPTPQLTAMPDRSPTEQGQGPNLQPHGS